MPLDFHKFTKLPSKFVLATNIQTPGGSLLGSELYNYTMELKKKNTICFLFLATKSYKKKSSYIH